MSLCGTLLRISSTDIFVSVLMSYGAALAWYDEHGPLRQHHCRYARHRGNIGHMSRSSLRSYSLGNAVSTRATILWEWNKTPCFASQHHVNVAPVNHSGPCRFEAIATLTPRQARLN